MLLFEFFVVIFVEEDVLTIFELGVIDLFFDWLFFDWFLLFDEFLFGFDGLLLFGYNVL